MTVNAQKFMTIDRSKIWMQVADQIKAMIERGELNANDRLPSERELCEQFGVSRMSVREALRKLQAQSYVDVKPGLGTFVVAANQRSVARLSDWVESHVDSLQKLIELRLVIEPGIAELAAKKATDEDVRQLMVRADALKDASEEDAGGADARFHLELASITENSMIEQIVEEILEATEELRKVTLKDGAHMHLAHEGHVRIADAVAARDPDGAAAAMRRHLLDARTSLMNDADN